MSSIKETILKKSSEIKDEVVDLRRHFHMYPELSYEEYGTSAFIAQWLERNMIPFRKDIAGTGIVASLAGKTGEGKVIAIRAEMDALPVTESNNTTYSSKYPGRMHACGHDAHMAMLMGAAMVLKSIKEEFKGTVLFIFQPGEEKCPGGARVMIEAGAFNNPRPDIFIAQHVLPELETGKAGFRSGRYMASCDELYFTVKGRGGHAALPKLTTDQIYIASDFIVRLKNQFRKIQEERQIPTVLGIGKISGQGATNVIPEIVEIAGTFRTFDEKWRAEGLQLIKLVAAEKAKEHGVTIDVRISEGYPVLVNDEHLTQRALELSRELLGEDKTETYDMRMSSDDFSFYSAIAPSLYYRVGIRKKENEITKLHTSGFEIDEEAFETGVSNLSWLVYNFLM